MRHPILAHTASPRCLAAADWHWRAAAAPARLLIFGEQHDQPDQQRQVAAEVQALAERGQLAAVVLEMAEQPHRTSALPRDASEAAVREALAMEGLALGALCARW